jgi:hypothetical protein
MIQDESLTSTSRVLCFALKIEGEYYIHLENTIDADDGSSSVGDMSQLTLNRPFGVNIWMLGGLYGYSDGNVTIPW